MVFAVFCSKDLEDKLSNDFIWSDDAMNFIWEIPILEDNNFIFILTTSDGFNQYITTNIEEK